MFGKVVKVVVGVATIIGGVILGKDGVCELLSKSGVSENVVDAVEETADAVEEAIEDLRQGKIVIIAVI